MATCYLVLEDGTVMEGTGFGYEQTVYGEVVFNTGMTGYQESLTDPSYRGQILIQSYPLIGNYGVNHTDFESDRVQVRGYVVRERCLEPSNMYAGDRIDPFLKKNRVPGISELDTRSLIIKIREKGTPRGAICFEEDVDKVLRKVQTMPFPSDSNLVDEVSVKEPQRFEREGLKEVVLIDCGTKQNIVRELRKRFSLTVVPYDVDPSFFRDHHVDGVMLSNGPGDPAHPTIQETTVRTLRAIKDDHPIMGVCFGNQLIARAFGGTTYKLKFGHRGVNQPVKYKDRVFITSQNHGFAVDPDSLPPELEVSMVNVNDGTVEGLRHKELPIFSAQYHPEASPGPKDTSFLFDEFAKLLEERR
ncbi:MAG: glutamine-hydrolyzing carbamoyl-phosphate synthase small subunit [Methanomassiliicoccales archaeon]|nr:glutamine-hydrolyzing carbamoyl-phosphate synthase small subunit [Methanomassiliicoccales archaeon]